MINRYFLKDAWLEVSRDTYDSDGRLMASLESSTGPEPVERGVMEAGTLGERIETAYRREQFESWIKADFPGMYTDRDANGTYTDRVNAMWVAYIRGWDDSRRK